MNVVAAGCVFPSGPGIDLASAALATGMSLIRRHPFHLDCSGSAARVSLFAQPAVFDASRWIDLARAALVDLHRQLPAPLPNDLQHARYKLYLTTPPADRVGVPADLAERLSQALAAGPFQFHSVQCVTGGHAAAVRMVHRASQAAADHGHCAIVLAVDSWLHPDALWWLERKQLLHGAGHLYHSEIRRNPYGRIPSEAGAAVMVHGSVSGWCRLQGIGLADEAIVRTDPRPCIGLGCTQAAQQALSGSSPEQKITHIVNDLNGEPYRADQFGFTCLRIASSLTDRWETITPALVSGDVGTATSVLQIALSANLLRRQAAAGVHPRHLLLSGSDDSQRAAVVMTL